MGAWGYIPLAFSDMANLTGNFYFREADIVCVESRLAASGANLPFKGMSVLGGKADFSADRRASLFDPTRNYGRCSSVRDHPAGPGMKHRHIGVIVPSTP
jgi:hypothetical protein